MGTMPLFMAAQNGNRAIVQALLEKGADITKANAEGDTTIPIAAKAGHLEVVEILKNWLLKQEAIEKSETCSIFCSNVRLFLLLVPENN